MLLTNCLKYDKMYMFLIFRKRKKILQEQNSLRRRLGRKQKTWFWRIDEES